MGTRMLHRSCHRRGPFQRNGLTTATTALDEGHTRAMPLFQWFEQQPQHGLRGLPREMLAAIQHTERAPLLRRELQAANGARAHARQPAHRDPTRPRPQHLLHGPNIFMNAVASTALKVARERLRIERLKTFYYEHAIERDAVRLERRRERLV